MPTLSRDLGDGLVLRAARPTDLDQLVAFNGAMHAEPDDTEPDDAIMQWTRDLFEVAHPTFRVEHATVVEDTTTGRIVSAMLSIPQRWSYAGVSIPVGRPELVATDTEYRRRGLIRAQFAEIHHRADTAGELFQFITGIPWYYRQFGYGYALDQPPNPVIVPVAKRTAAESRWSVRLATTTDIAFLERLDATPSETRSHLRCVRDAAAWQLEFERRPNALAACQLFVIEDDAAGTTPEPIGYVIHQNHLWAGQLPVRALELLPGRSWLGPTAAVVAHAQNMADMRSATAVTFALPAGHPALSCLATRLAHPVGPNYGIYVRVADAAAFLRVVAPVLEERLAASPAVNYSGVLLLDFYVDGLQLSFKDGRFVSVAPWRPPHDSDHADAAMPRDAFVHLLLGNRTITELETALADCLVNTDAGGLLLDALFPRTPWSRWWLG